MRGLFFLAGSCDMMIMRAIREISVFSHAHTLRACTSLHKSEPRKLCASLLFGMLQQN